MPSTAWNADIPAGDNMARERDHPRTPNHEIWFLAPPGSGLALGIPGSHEPDRYHGLDSATRVPNSGKA